MDFWAMAYRLGWAKEADLEKAVTLGLITAEQKTIIVEG